MSDNLAFSPPIKAWLKTGTPLSIIAMKDWSEFVVFLAGEFRMVPLDDVTLVDPNPYSMSYFGAPPVSFGASSTSSIGKVISASLKPKP